MEQTQVEVEQNGTVEATEKIIAEFTNLDAENLYTSALEIQKKACRKIDGVEINSLPLDLDMALANFIGKLYKWITPFTESKKKIAESFSFVQNGGQWTITKKMSDDEQLTKTAALLKEFQDKNDEPFPKYEDLKNIMPIKVFTETRIKEANVYFKDCPNRQLFLQYCLKQPDQL